MKIETKTIYTFDNFDFKWIRVQMKNEHITVKSLCEENGFSRSYFYDMAKGRRNAEPLIIALGYHFIYPTYNIARDER